MKLNLGLFLLLLCITGITREVPAATVSDIYQSGVAAFNEGSYRKALGIFENLLERDVTPDLCDNVHYWRGECYLALDMTLDALACFEQVFLFPDANKRDDALIQTGMCYERMGRHAAACMIWRSLPRLGDQAGNKRQRVLRKYCGQ